MASAVSNGLTSRSLSSPALPFKLALQRGKGALQGLADEPPLLVGYGVEGLDGLRRRPRIELHRPAGAIDPWRTLWDRLAAREPRSLGDPADKLGRNLVQSLDADSDEAGVRWAKSARSCGGRSRSGRA